MSKSGETTLMEGSLATGTTKLNLGPTHPATHGVFQNILELDGETIVNSEQTVGYIHRAFEKIAERRPLYQITPLTDRMNYCSSPINNMGWHLTCEKLLGVKTPKRVDYLRIIIMELARISDHLICNSIVGVDTGAYTGFLYVMQYRELIYEIWEEVCGSRLTTNIGSLGGIERIRGSFQPQPHFYGAHDRCRSDQCGKSIELWFYRSKPARCRCGLRCKS